MKKKVEHRKIIFAWVMLLSLMPFFFVKATHFHKEHDSICKSSDHHAAKACNDCLICHFILSPFTETETVEVQPIIVDYNPLLVFYNDKQTYKPVFSYNLRAPPTQSSYSL